MSYLLDGMNEDLNRIINKPLVPPIDNTNIDFDVKLYILKELANLSWENHKKRNDSVINDIFCGLYKSHLVCPCGNKSDIFEPFTSLTVLLYYFSYQYLIKKKKKIVMMKI